MAGYELILIVWGVAWMSLGAVMMYLIHRVMAADNRRAEEESRRPEVKAPVAVGQRPPRIAA